MKNFWKKISEFLFGKKDSISPECEKVYKELEKVKKECISDEEFRSLSDEQQKEVLQKELDVQKDMTSSFDTDYVTSGYLRREDDIIPPPYTVTVYTEEPTIMGTSIDIDGKLRVRERPIITNPEFVGMQIKDKKGKIHFFSPEDNKEIKLDEKKSDDIKATKKKRQYKKKKK